MNLLKIDPSLKKIATTLMETVELLEFTFIRSIDLLITPSIEIHPLAELADIYQPLFVKIQDNKAFVIGNSWSDPFFDVIPTRTFLNGVLLVNPHAHLVRQLFFASFRSRDFEQDQIVQDFIYQSLTFVDSGKVKVMQFRANREVYLALQGMVTLAVSLLS